MGSSVRDLLGSAAQIGFGLDREVARWARRGDFMYVLNHPKAFVIGDIARRLLEESGLRPEPVEIEAYIGDELARDVVWPVYPPIAEAFGLTGSYLFKAKPRGKDFPRLYDLPGFVAASFSHLRRAVARRPRLPAGGVLARRPGDRRAFRGGAGG